jgi:hypothetical protein
MMVHVQLPDLQIKEDPLGHFEGFCDWKEGLLLHGMRLRRLHLHSPPRRPQEKIDDGSVSRFEIVDFYG